MNDRFYNINISIIQNISYIIACNDTVKLYQSYRIPK